MKVGIQTHIQKITELKLDQLDLSQQKFCEAPHGNIRLLAPAGCGKTLCLLFRCAHLVKEALPQHLRFLIVTFTVSAKEELQNRVSEDERFMSIQDNIEVITLNSWGFRRIKNISFSTKLLTSRDDYHFAMLNQLQPIWKKYDRIKDAIEQKSNTTPRKLMDIIDAFKSIGFDHVRQTNYELFAQRLKELREQGLKHKIDEIIDNLVRLGVLSSRVNRRGEECARTGDKDVHSAFFRFWREATQHLIDSATFTLEDQKYYAYLDERQKLEEGKYLTGAARYDHILVDEFQDINPLDLALIKAISERNRAMITVVGDDDQAIFEWRGATPEYILNPSKFFGVEFPHTLTLQTNYRSPRNIVEHAQKLIANNVRRVDKPIHSILDHDAEIDVRETETFTEAMDIVHDEVRRFVIEGRSPSRVAIIGRKRSQIIPYQIFFASKEVPFCAAEDLQIFMSNAFNRLLRLIMIKNRCESRQMRSQVIDDVLELCNYVKRYPVKRSDREAIRRHLSLSRASTTSESVEVLAGYRGPLKGSNKDGTIAAGMADSIRSFLQATTVRESLIKMGMRFEGLQIDLGKSEVDIFYTDPPFLYLAEYAERYGDDYMQFVEDIERAKEQLVYVPPMEDETDLSSDDDLWMRPLHLMTALRAKGKEFDCVILLDVNDGIWPNKNAKELDELEAERRVFYVAFTRSRKKVLILVARNLGSRKTKPSPYISELGL
ncbi:MAG: ATP-dependent helicase [Sedimentisphaerales bacterium]|nr:ATP-dependent helicase [Sedimentisphaerales bacterium]